MHILIAEDEPSLRENLQWLLEMEGYTVVAAHDGMQALEFACLAPPDLVLTDVMMPHLDGYGLVKALRETTATSTVPIIMLTAKADRRDVRTGMNLGADDYLTKPYRREELLDAVHARLARKASLDATARRLQDEALEAQQRDALTALPGRELFGQRLKMVLTPVPGAPTRSVGLVCLGLDGFSKINDSLGAAVGDKVLVEVAARLSEHLRTEAHPMGYDCVARLGSDQFAVCLGDSPDLTRLEGACTGLQQLLAQPYRIDGHTLFLTASAGASLFPQQASDAHALLLNAETALHHAKPAGPGTVRVFDAEMNQQVARRLQVHNALHSALDLNELQLYYQPQVSIATGEVVGFEALLRWQQPTLGWVSPAEFIPIAEESGFITRIGAWAMRTAATQAAQWHAQGHQKFRMAVNLSVRQFVGNNLPELVSKVLAETGLPPDMLELEVTESLALHSVASTLATLHACKALGVKLAMDDFGTGYSSLAYLKRYPLDALKIDQAFVRNITQDAGDAAITRAIVAMSHSFGISVIAEGVETVEQLDFLRTLGCEEFQGYLFSRPVPAHDAEKCFAGFTPPNAPFPSTR
ncbi:MAG: EAL domain-containing protein [Burkholderiales bacterium]|nr:EAL domain-containing protein [Burkholderiales bacterium]